MGSWFPFEYRDVSGWKAEGLPLTSSSSSEAAKMLDATVAQFSLLNADPQVP